MAVTTFTCDQAGSVNRVVAPLYTGPGDIAAGAYAWGGLQAYSAAAAAALMPAIDMTTTSQIPYPGNPITVLATGKLDTTAAAAAIGGGYTHVAKIYDQTGNGRHWTARTAGYYSPLSLTSGPDGAQPAINTGDGFYDSTATQTVGQSWCVVAVVKSTAASYFFGPDNDALVYLGYNGTAYRFAAGGSEITVTGSTSNFYCVRALASGSSSALFVDASTSSLNAGPSGWTGAHIGWGEHALLAGIQGSICELGIWNSDISANFSALSTNAHSSGRWNWT